MFKIDAYNNPYLQIGQSTLQAVLSIGLDTNVALAPAPLALAIVLDCSASMNGPKIHAARDGAVKVVQALEPTMVFMVVIFNGAAQVIFGPAPGTDENKKRAVIALQTVSVSGGTRMSTALHAVAEKFGRQRSRVTKVLFLTDGKNEGELRPALDQAVNRCKALDISIHAWGVGTDWDAEELLHMAEATHGNADIIPTPQQIETAFTTAFNEMRKTAITNVRLALWSPVGVQIPTLSQVYPTIAPLELEPDPVNPRQRVVAALGSFAAGDQRDYLLNLEVPIYPPGQHFMVVRPSLKFFVGGTQETEEKSTRAGWVFVQWTQDTALAAQVETHIAHYTSQEALSKAMKEGQDALAIGDRAKATRLLGQALEMSERLQNDRATKLLREIVHRDANGTIRLNQQVDAVANKTLAINVGRTTRLN
jgi:Ca-activated chloride channel family protein